jgi:hypothetical protein
MHLPEFHSVKDIFKEGQNITSTNSMYQTEMNKTVEDNLTISFWMKGNVAVYIYMIDLYETKQEILKFDKSRSGNYHISLAKFSKPHPWNSLSDDD